jgi:hydroxylamine reductase (hybrid-cluster protein)
MTRDAQSIDLSTENSRLSSITASTLLNKNYWETLSESTDLFFKSLKLGMVRGVVSIVDVPTSGRKDDSGHMQLAQELIRRDILVTISPCETGGINPAELADPDLCQTAGDGLAEFCEYIGIQPVLHIDGSINETDVLGFYNGLARHAAVEASALPAATIALCRQPSQAERSGTLFIMEDDPAKRADLIDEHIHNKRLGVQWCDRCGCHFSPFS